MLNHRLLYDTLGEIKPDSIIHYAEQPSALFDERKGKLLFYSIQ